MPSQITPPEFELPEIPASLEGEELREYLSDVQMRLQDQFRALYQDLTQGRPMWPVLSDVDSTDTVPGSFCYEYDDPRRYTWARILEDPRGDSSCRILTNLPQNYIGLTGRVQNDGQNGWGVWTFPQGGFKAATVPFIQATVATDDAAHFLNSVHIVSTAPATTNNLTTTVYFDEFHVVAGALAWVGCVDADMYADVLAIGEPP